MLVSAAGAPARAAQCTPKTAGYFLQAEPSLKTVSPSTMAGIIASLTGSIGDPVRGRLIMADRERGNCLACHRVAVMSEEPNQGNLGPNLNAVGGRYTEAQLRQLIVDPKMLYPNTVMPAFHAAPDFARVPEGLAGKPVLSAGEVEDVIAFLKNLK
jgi:sulfur-oxidizing protein SoxX